MGQEFLDFGCPELPRMGTFVKLQVTAQPLQVRMLRAQRKMTSPYALAGKRKQVRVAIHASVRRGDYLMRLTGFFAPLRSYKWRRDGRGDGKGFQRLLSRAGRCMSSKSS